MHSSVNVRVVNSQQLKFNAVNGQSPENQRGQQSKHWKELVKVWLRGHSHDYRVYGSDTPLATPWCGQELIVKLSPHVHTEHTSVRLTHTRPNDYSSGDYKTIVYCITGACGSGLRTQLKHSHTNDKASSLLAVEAVVPRLPHRDGTNSCRGPGDHLGDHPAYVRYMHPLMDNWTVRCEWIFNLCTGAFNHVLLKRACPPRSMVATGNQGNDIVHSPWERRFLYSECAIVLWG